MSDNCMEFMIIKSPYFLEMNTEICKKWMKELRAGNIDKVRSVHICNCWIWAIGTMGVH